MKRKSISRIAAAAGLAACVASHAAASIDRTIWTDPIGDALLRRTDPGAVAALLPGAVLPDVLSVSLFPWAPLNAACDPYVGLPASPEAMHLVRIDVVFAGLVNPPGPLGLNGANFSPACFGPSPVYGHIEFDIDVDEGTGGEFPSQAKSRTLAVAGRYSARPTNPLLAPRVPTCAADLDFDWLSPPYFERTGTDFGLAFCGCHDSILISETGDLDGIFDAGETMVVRGRFFQRAGGYRLASNMQGGSTQGAYDPVVNVRFVHEPTSNLTIVSLVYPLTMTGAAMLTGEPEQPIDNLIDEQGSHHSIIEALTDLVNGAHGSLSGLTAELTSRWIKKDPAEFLNPLHWNTTFTVGTTYLEQGVAIYAWTDQGFDLQHGDVNGDGGVTTLDRAMVEAAISSLDGSLSDFDGLPNGEVVLGEPGTNFSIYDVTGDAIISQVDLDWFPPAPRCDPDWNSDGLVDVPDIFAFLTDWFSDMGDYNQDGLNAVDDIFAFLTAWFLGCQ